WRAPCREARADLRVFPRCPPDEGYQPHQSILSLTHTLPPVATLRASAAGLFFCRSDGRWNIRPPLCAVRGVCYGRLPPRPPPRCQCPAEEDQNQRRPEEHLSRTRGEGNLSDKRLSSPPGHWLHRMD